MLSSTTPAQLLSLLIPIVYVGVIATVVWQVVFAIRRISFAIEDMAQTLRSIARKEGGSTLPPAEP